MSIAESLAKAGYLAPVAEALQQIGQARRQKQQYEAMLNNYQNLGKQLDDMRNPVVTAAPNALINGISNNFQANNIDENKDIPLIPTNRPGASLVSSISPSINEHPNPFDVNRKGSQLIQDFAISNLINPDASPENKQMVGSLVSALNTKLPQLPKRETKVVDKNLLSITENPDGTTQVKPLYEGPEDWKLGPDGAYYYNSKGENKSNPEYKQKFDIEGSYKNDKTGTYWSFDKNTGQYVDSKIPFDRKEGRTTVNIHQPKAEKWSLFGKLKTELLSPERVVPKKDTDDNIIGWQTYQKSDIEKKKDGTTFYNQLIGNLLPGAKTWYEKEIKGKWGRENISNNDFLDEVKESYKKGDITNEEAQDLIDFSAYRSDINKLDNKDYKYKGK